MSDLSWDNHVTFGVAFLAYVQLTALVTTSLLPGVVDEPRRVSRLDRARRVLSATTFVTALTHAICVWNFRYQWVPANGIRNGWPSAIFFHGALLALLVVVIRARSRRSNPVLLVAWLIVAGTTPVPFSHEEVAWLKVPLVIVTTFGTTIVGYCAIHGLRRLWKRRGSQAKPTPFATRNETEEAEPARARLYTEKGATP